MDDAVAVITDIHGNLAALNASLARIAELSIERIYCGGDLVGYGPSSVADRNRGSVDPESEGAGWQRRT
jgi:Icc-related predicted phosphoesterase